MDALSLDHNSDLYFQRYFFKSDPIAAYVRTCKVLSGEGAFPCLLAVIRDTDRIYYVDARDITVEFGKRMREEKIPLKVEYLWNAAHGRVHEQLCTLDVKKLKESNKNFCKMRQYAAACNTDDAKLRQESLCQILLTEDTYAALWPQSMLYDTLYPQLAVTLHFKSTEDFKSELQKIFGKDAEKLLPLLCGALLSNSHLQRALKLFHKSDEVRDMLFKAADLHPGSALVQLCIGWWYGKEAKEFLKAFEHTARAVQLDHNSACAHRVLGSLYLRGLGVEKNGVAALHHLTQSLALDPNSARTHTELGKLHLETDTMQASKHLLQAITLDECCADAHATFGELRRRGSPASLEAFMHLTQAIDLDPDSAYPHVGLGILHHDGARGVLALKHLTRAIEIKPDYAEAYRLLGELFRVGDGNEVAVDAVRALGNLTIAVTIDPDCAFTQERLGELYRVGGEGVKIDLKLAHKHLTRALELDPDSTFAKKSLKLVERQL